MNGIVNNAIINNANAFIWADIYAQIETINTLNSVDEFYGIVIPIRGVKEVYDRLSDWRKAAYKNFLMSGSFRVYQFGEQMSPNSWGWGEYSCPQKAFTRVQKYPTNAYDWLADLEREYDTSLSWEEVCELYSF